MGDDWDAAGPEWMAEEMIERTTVSRGMTTVFQFGRQPVVLTWVGGMFVKDADEMGSDFALCGTELGKESLTRAEVASIPVYPAFKNDDDDIWTMGEAEGSGDESGT